jgi:hypothetical protein
VPPHVHLQPLDAHDDAACDGSRPPATATEFRLHDIKEMLGPGPKNRRDEILLVILRGISHNLGQNSTRFIRAGSMPGCRPGAVSRRRLYVRSRTPSLIYW